MPDYKKMYLRMFRASEEAVQLLIEAQRECEELFLKEEGPALLLFDPARQEPPEAD